MKVAAGIRGIRNIVATNKSGWHVWVDGEYTTYMAETLLQIRTTYHGYTLTSVTGNGLTFEKR